MKIFQHFIKITLTAIFIVHGIQTHPSKSHDVVKSKTVVNSSSYEQALNSATSNYLKDLQSANKDEAKVMTAMDKYEQELNLIDQKYPDEVKTEAAQHLQKMTERKARWHNYDLAYTNLKNKFAKELDPYWKAQQEIWQASWNRNMEKDVNFRKMANELSQIAMHSLEFQYSDALARFHVEMQKLSQQYSF